MLLETFNKLFEYKSEQGDQWRILSADDLRGDCEDAALSILFHIIADGSLFKFWLLLIFGRAKICYCTVGREGHAVLRYGDIYIDNIQQEWVALQTLVDHHYKFTNRHYYFWQVAIKMLLTKFRG